VPGRVYSTSPMPEVNRSPRVDSTQPALAARPSDSSSLELIRRAQRGETGALSLLIGRYVPFLRRLAHGRVPQWARTAIDTADLVQETLLRTFRRLDAFEPRGEGAMRAYLRQALQNRIHNLYRDATRRPRFEALADHYADAGPSPLDLAMTASDRERYERALRALDAGDRQAIVGRVELGYSYEQLAAVLGKRTPDAARMAVRRALLRLATAMNARENDHPLDGEVSED
jgi:RNA polymerase sigma factor (sigma-70 family)